MQLTSDQIKALTDWTAQGRVWISISHNREDLPDWTNDQFEIPRGLLARIAELEAALKPFADLSLPTARRR